MIFNLLLLIDSTSIKLHGIFGQLNTKVHFKNYTINMILVPFTMLTYCNPDHI